MPAARLLDPPVDAEILGETDGGYVVSYRHPEGWTKVSTRRADEVILSVGDPRAAEILRRWREDPKYYKATFMDDARRLLKEIDGKSPRNAAAMIARLETR